MTNVSRMNRFARMAGLLTLALASACAESETVPRGPDAGGTAEAPDSTTSSSMSALATRPLPPFSRHMAWHQGNRDGFHVSQLALLHGHRYDFVIIPKMHRENLEGEQNSYYTSLGAEVAALRPYQPNIMGYFNARFYCTRFYVPGHPASGFTRDAPRRNNQHPCPRIFTTDGADKNRAHQYVDLALQAIADAGADGVYIDLPWEGKTDNLGPLAGYIIFKASTLFSGNIVVNTKSYRLGVNIGAHLADPAAGWIANIERTGPSFCISRGREQMSDTETVNTLMSQLLTNVPTVHGIVGTSVACDENDPGTWGSISDYGDPGRACASRPDDCYFECSNGFACSTVAGQLECGTGTEGCDD